MRHAVSHLVPDYRDQPNRSAFWRTDVPQGVELVAGYIGVKRMLRHQARRLPLQAAGYAVVVIALWLWASFSAGVPKPFPWLSILVGELVILPAFWIVGSVWEGRQGLAVHVLRDGLHVHRQDVIRGRWRHWQREQLSRVYVNWEGWIVLLGPDGKCLGKFGGEPGRIDMKWLAGLIRGRLGLKE